MNVTSATSGKEMQQMAAFTIDTDNNIAAHAGPPPVADNLHVFTTQKELAKLSAE